MSTAGVPDPPPRARTRWSAGVAAAFALMMGACALLPERLLLSLLAGSPDAAHAALFVRLAVVAISAVLLYRLLLRRELAGAAREQALRESEGRLRRWAALSPDWYWETDEEFRLTRVVGTSPETTAMPAGAFIGKRHDQLRGLRLDSMADDEFAALRDARLPYRDVRFRHTDEVGKESWFSVSGEPRVDALGRYAGYHGVTRDVTAEALERRAAETSLQDAQQRLRTMFDLANMGVTEVALDGRFLRVNPAFCRITGYTEAELLCMSGQALTPPEDMHLSLDRMADAVRGLGDRFTVEKRYTRKDGHTVWVELYSALARDANGEPAYFVSMTQDITLRRAAGEALRDSEARYRSVIDHMRAGLIQHAADGSIIDCNTRALELLSLTREQLLSRAPADEAWNILDADGRPMPPGDWPVRRVLRHGTAIESEVLGIIGAGGSVVWLQASAAPFPGKPGEPHGAVQTFVDVTGEREAVAALRRSEGRYRTVVDALSEGVLLVGPDGQVLTVNPAARAIYGMDFMQLVAAGPAAREFHLYDEQGRPIPPEARPSSLARESGKPVRDVNARIVRSDGSQAWLRVSALPVALDGADGVLLVIADITAARAAENALKASEMRYRSVIETMSEGILLLDAAGRVIGSNHAATRVFGITAESVGTAGPLAPILRLFHPDGRELAIEERPSYRALVRGESVTGAIYRARRPDDSMIWLEINAGRLPLGATEPPGVLITITDISARVEAEHDLKALTDTLERRVAERTEELSQLNRELESFAYSVSHDLRAPLRAITGFASLLGEDEQDRLSEEGQDLLRRIRGNAQRMGELIDDVLEYSRITRIDRKRESVDVDALVRDVLAPMQQAYPDAHCTVAQLGIASADQAMLRQIFQNLLENAFKYSSKAGRPEIRVDRLVEDERTWYRVSDNGIGFDMRYADRLFGMFQRMHAATDYSGTGVGLAIVKRLVERHGGQVRADSQPGQGTVFRFHLGSAQAETTV